MVEDDAEIAEAMENLLTEEGYEVTKAVHGKHALELLRYRPVDLIVLDLRLPVMDGWQFRTIQRAHPDLSQIPVVAVSADGSPKAEAIDAAGYLKKPFKANDLLLVIERALLAHQRQVLTERLRATERLTTLGTIAATVGHEINNPLTYVLGNLELLQKTVSTRVEDPLAPPDYRWIAELLAEVRTGAERIRSVADSLRVVSRRSDEGFAPVDINALVRGALAMTSIQVQRRARLRLDLGDSVSAFGSQARLGQVLINLLVNAAQAIPPGDPEQHEVVVRTRASTEQAMIEVSDTGSGIPAEVQERVFEPFFTTKPPSEGTGIGLAISKRIVHEHRGRIEFDTRPGVGTTFRVLLPVERGTVTPQPRSPPRDLPALGRSKQPRRARVLLVDDDPLVLASLQRELEQEFRVVAASGGRAALDLLRAGQRFDAVVCDVTMPDMTGVQFSAEMERQRPGSGTRLVFVSGGPMPPEIEAFRNVTRAEWLDKPFDGETLRACVRELLSRVGLS